MKSERIHRNEVLDVQDALYAIMQSGQGRREGAELAIRQIRRAMQRRPQAEAWSVRPSLNSEWALGRAVHMARNAQRVP